MKQFPSQVNHEAVASDLISERSGGTVVGRNPAPVQVGSLSHDLHGLIHPRWCRISSINSTSQKYPLPSGELTWQWIVPVVLDF